MAISHEERNKQAFNEIEECEDHGAGLRKANFLISVLADLVPRAHIADVGCHNGVYTKMYGATPGVESIHGFDVADKALAKARERGLQVSSWVGGTEPCPASDNQFDVLIASEVIEHIVDTEFFIAELKRVIKPGGHAILTTPNLYYWLNRVKFLFAETPWDYPAVSNEFKVNRNINTEHIRVNGIQEWSAFFAARGFEVLQAKGFPWAYPTGFKGSVISLIDKIAPSNAQCLGLYVLKNNKKV